MSKELKMLREQLSKLLNWNKARMTFLAGMLLALLKEKTVNPHFHGDMFIGVSEGIYVGCGRKIKIQTNPEISKGL